MAKAIQIALSNNKQQQKNTPLPTPANHTFTNNIDENTIHHFIENKSKLLYEKLITSSLFFSLSWEIREQLYHGPLFLCPSYL